MVVDINALLLCRYDSRDSPLTDVLAPPSQMSVLREPVQHLDHEDVSNLLKLPFNSSVSLESEKPKRCLTAYNLFFRDERSKLLSTLPCREEGKPRHSHGKISFKDLARTVSAHWKLISADEKDYYTLLACEDKMRYKKELKEWKNKVKQQKSEQADVLAHAVIDLPNSLETIFEDAVDICPDIELSVEHPEEFRESKPHSRSVMTTPLTRVTTSTIVSDNSSSSSASSYSSSSSEISLQGQAQMEKVFGPLPSLLGSLADDQDWSF